MRSAEKRENGTGVVLKPRNFSLFPVLVFLAFSAVSCGTSAARAEEYYALGAGYFELQKYAEAESWFNKAKFNRVTKHASEYNLGRIAYETGRYEEAKAYFAAIISEDEDNVTALKAIAYTSIKLDELDLAEIYYQRIQRLEPESYDEGYNYALVLAALGKTAEAETILLKYNDTENSKALLVLARVQKYQGKPEAADAYAASLLKEDDPEVRIEYAAYLESIGLPEKALEEYRTAMESSGLSEEKKEEAARAVTRLETDGEGSAEAQH